MVDYRSYYAHHLALWFTSGRQSKKLHVDHINGVKDDNRIENLRVVTPSKNGLNRKRPNKNNTSGFTGVCLWQGKWLAQIQVNRKTVHLGLFDNIADAARARAEAHARYCWGQ